MYRSKDMEFIDFRRKNNMASNKQDGVQNGRQTDPHGTIFRNESITIRLLEALGLQKYIFQ